MSILDGWSVMGPKGTVGPVSADAVRAAVEAGHVRRGDLVRHEYDADWQRVEVSMFGTSLPVELRAAPRPLLSWVPDLAHWALWAFLAWGLVEFLRAVDSLAVRSWTLGIVGFLVLYVAGMRARTGR